jgi:hypothetical protein
VCRDSGERDAEDVSTEQGPLPDDDLSIAGYASPAALPHNGRRTWDTLFARECFVNRHL